MPWTWRANRAAIIGSLAAVLACSTAAADIASFNAAVRAKDWAAASAAARETWPGIAQTDPLRGAVANEFAFAAYMAGDFEDSRTFADIAASSTVTPDETRGIARVTGALARFRIRPGSATADGLDQQLARTSPEPGADLMSYLAHSALIDHLVSRRKWANARAAALRAQADMAQGGSAFRPESRSFALMEIAAGFQATGDNRARTEMAELRNRLMEDIDSAPSDAAAQPFVDLYWQAEAHLISLGSAAVFNRGKARPLPPDVRPPYSERQSRLLHGLADAKTCQRVGRMQKRPRYPQEASAWGIVGTVILVAEVSEEGRLISLKTLAAAPPDMFLDRVMRSLKDFRVEKGEVWGEGCSLATRDYLITWRFDM